MNEGNPSEDGALWRAVTQGEDTPETLRESEARYRTLVEQAPIAIVVHVDAQIVYANAVAVAALGATSQDDLVGRSIWDFVDQAYQETVAERIEALDSQQHLAPIKEEKFNTNESLWIVDTSQSSY